MGTQKRYASGDASAWLERAYGTKRATIEDAAEAIERRQAINGRPEAVYGGDGHLIGDPQFYGAELGWVDRGGRVSDEPVTGGHQLKTGTRADGADGRLLVTPADEAADVLERVYLVHGCESPAVMRWRRATDVLMAAIALGRVEPAPTTVVEQLAATWAATAAGPQHVRYAETLRVNLGLPSAPWSASADAAAKRGRAIAAELQSRHAP